MLFGKRKPVDAAHRAGATAPIFGRGSGPRALATVLVPRSAVDRASDPEHAYDLIEAVRVFVRSMTEVGQYLDAELPAKAIQILLCDYYVGQVNNGGHDQFISNSGGDLQKNSANALIALREMGAQAQLSCLEEMTALVLAGEKSRFGTWPDEPGSESSFGHLDKRFFEADRSDPIYPHAARWISSWPELKAVDDREWHDVLNRTAMLNPVREQRLALRSIAALRAQTTDRLSVGAGLACANLPVPELRIALGAGQAFDIDGRQQWAFTTRTNTGANRLCVVNDDYAAAYERVEFSNPPMPDVRDSAGMAKAITDGTFGKYRAPTIGRRLSHVAGHIVQQAIDLAAQHRVAVAVDLALRKAGLDPTGSRLAPASVDRHPTLGKTVIWLVGAGSRAMIGASAQDRFRLTIKLPQGVQELAVLGRREIDQHAAQEEAGRRDFL